MTDCVEILWEIANEIEQSFRMEGQGQADFVADCIRRVLKRHQPKDEGPERHQYETVSDLLKDRANLRVELEAERSRCITAEKELAELKERLRTVTHAFSRDVITDEPTNMGKRT